MKHQPRYRHRYYGQEIESAQSILQVSANNYHLHNSTTIPTLPSPIETAFLRESHGSLSDENPTTHSPSVGDWIDARFPGKTFGRNTTLSVNPDQPVVPRLIEE